MVPMLGDGVPDPPVLAETQVSVAMGGGAQLARLQSDFILTLGKSGSSTLDCDAGRKTLKIIRKIFGGRFAYNFVALPLAIAGYVTPWITGIGMSASSLLVVLNSLRIQRVRD
ncbi:MAG: hypothetical protein IPF44_12945 [Betaproteobacteria bacterium]|nr:hypothetical protein [Betaproteobacteria bacterium]